MWGFTALHIAVEERGPRKSVYEIQKGGRQMEEVTLECPYDCGACECLCQCHCTLGTGKTKTKKHQPILWVWEGLLQSQYIDLFFLMVHDGSSVIQES